MDLLERYLQSVGEYLPARSKADTLAELRENLLAEMESLEEELGRALTQSEVAEVLEKHGRPVLVAARYLPQQHLIGPAWFPIYWFTLKKSFPLVVLAYAVTQVAAWLFQSGSHVDVGAVLGHFPAVALIFWAVFTLGFACFEYAEGRYFHRVNFSRAWNPNDLPRVEPAQRKRPSLVSRVADAVMAAVGMVWLLALPYMLLGLRHMREMPFQLAPEWRIFYWRMVALLGMQLALKIVRVALHGSEGWRNGIDIAVQVIGLVILAVMVQAHTYLVPGSGAGAMSVQDLGILNTALNMAFKVSLAIAVIKMQVDLWKRFFSSRTGNNWFAPVL